MALGKTPLALVALTIAASPVHASPAPKILELLAARAPCCHMAFATPRQRRDSIKNNDASSSRTRRKEALKELGRQQRHAILQQHRQNNLSPVGLEGKLHADTMAAIRQQLYQPEPDGGVLTEADIDSLLADLEQQVMQEIQAELAELERQELEQQQHAAHMAEQHMQYLQQHGPQQGGHSPAECALCPVCKGCQLVARQGLLVCPAEGWRLNLAAESLSMGDIKQRLAAAYEEHAASGCGGQLQFSIEDLFGSDSLTCSCTTCNSLAVVV